MVTQPMEGETISDPHPTLKANLATFGEVDPNSVEIRLSGIGQLPVKYDAASKTAEANVTQKLATTSYTVILSAKVKGRKVETRWNFNFAPEGSPPTRLRSHCRRAPHPARLRRHRVAVDTISRRCLSAPVRGCPCAALAGKQQPKTGRSSFYVFPSR
jgi:hypothetical protein